MTAPALHTAPTLEQIEAARRALEGIAQRTPMERSKALGAVLGADVFIKCENLQRTGSYKVRGAYTCMSALPDDRRGAGVVAASAGNHAQGVALAARELGIQATIFMPVGVALPKLQATRSYGADVRLVGEHVGQSLDAAREFAEQTGATFIPPFDSLPVITGAATVGLEIMEQCPQARTVVVPVGGGGLLAGVASAVKQLAERRGEPIRVIGVQSEQASAFLPSLAAGHPVTIELGRTIADGIAVATPGERTLAIAEDLVDQVVTVSDEQIAMAIVLLLERAKLVVEPAGAAAAAAILAGAVPADGPTVAIASGGNIDPLLLQQLIGFGLVELSRYATLSVMLPDRPGQLQVISEVIAECGANVVGVLHTRHGRGLAIGNVELQVSVETRGAEHLDTLLAALRERGFDPTIVR